MSKGAQTRQQILDHALRLASEIGLEGVSIGALASRVGMSKSGLFAHFSSKENLDVAVLEEASRRFVDLVIAPALRKPRGEPRVVALLDGWLQWVQQDFLPGGCIFLAAAVELDDRPGPARDKLVAAQRDWFDTLAQAVRIAQREGHFRADLDPEQFAFEAFGLVEAYMFFARLLKLESAEGRLRTAQARLLDDARARS